jgi:hypothetical protein
VSDSQLCGLKSAMLQVSRNAIGAQSEAEVLPLEGDGKVLPASRKHWTSLGSDLTLRDRQ